jgi:T5orf172 domain
MMVSKEKTKQYRKNRRLRAESREIYMELEVLKRERPDIDWDLVVGDFQEKMGHHVSYGRRRKRGKKVAVYLVAGGAEGPTKVGVANDVRKRLAQLQTGHPYPLFVHSMIWFDISEAAYAAERWLLQEVDSSARLSGEWIGMKPAVLREMLYNFANRHLSSALLRDITYSNEAEHD